MPDSQAEGVTRRDPRATAPAKSLPPDTPMRAAAAVARPAARHSPRESPRHITDNPIAAANPTNQTVARPTGPNSACPASNPTLDSIDPIAPPSPDVAGQAKDRAAGTLPKTAANSGIATSKHASRPAKLPIPRCDAIRQAHASIAIAGKTPASPNPWRNRSASIAPPCPARLAACRVVAVFKEGSCGSYVARAISTASPAMARNTPPNSADRWPISAFNAGDARRRASKVGVRVAMSRPSRGPRLRVRTQM